MEAGTGAGAGWSSCTTTREWQAANTIAVSPLASHTSDSDGTAEAEDEEEEEEEEGADWWSAALMTPTGTSWSVVKVPNEKDYSVF